MNDLVSDLSGSVSIRHLMIGPEIDAAILNSKVSKQIFVRTTWTGRTKKVVAKRRPTNSRSRKLDTPIGIGVYDPWLVVPYSLSQNTKQLVVCDTCDGEKQIDCFECGGSSYFSCDNCSGTGRVRSKKGDRIINCLSCVGKGERKCRSRNGLVKCGACIGKGKVERWLEIEEKPFRVQRVMPMQRDEFNTPWTKPYTKNIDPKFACETPGIKWQGKTLRDSPPGLSGYFSKKELNADLDPLCDRLQTVEVEEYCRDLTSVHYKVCGVTGTVGIVGPKNTIVQNGKSSKPLYARLLVLTLTGLFSLLTGFIMWSQYVGQDQFFEGTFNDGFSSILAKIWPIAMMVFANVLLYSRFRRNRKLLGFFAAPAILLFLGIIVLTNTGYPSIAVAKEQYANGDYMSAAITTGALLKLDIDKKEAAILLDDMRLRNILNNTDWEKGLQFLSTQFEDKEMEKRSHEYSVRLVATHLKTLQSVGKYSDAAVTLRKVPPKFENSRFLRPVYLSHYTHKTEKCIDAAQTKCFLELLLKLEEYGVKSTEIDELRKQADTKTLKAFGSTQDGLRDLESLGSKVTVYEKLQKYHAFISVAGTRTTVFPLSSEYIGLEIQNIQAQIEKERLAEEKRIAKEQKREEKRIRAQEAKERRRAAREERRYRMANRRAKCCDGTLSPSCGCGGGRGCCSHHGGVCGCSD